MVPAENLGVIILAFIFCCTNAPPQHLFRYPAFSNVLQICLLTSFPCQDTCGGFHTYGSTVHFPRSSVQLLRANPPLVDLHCAETGSEPLIRAPDALMTGKLLQSHLLFSVTVLQPQESPGRSSRGPGQFLPKPLFWLFLPQVCPAPGFPVMISSFW